MERGGLFGALRERHGGATLDEITRQRGDGDRRASHLLSEGQYREALAHYDAAGRVKWADNQEQKLGQAVAAWARDSAADPKASRLVLAGSNREVLALNAAMREVRKARGELGTAEDRAAWKQAQKTGVELPQPTEHVLQTKDGRAAFAVGDRVIFNETVKKAGLLNGQRSTVEKIEGAILTVRLDGKDGKPGELRVIDTREFQSFRHGYASTIHKAQGQTVDAAYIVHSQQMRGRAAYVAMTRHRDGAQMFAARDEARDLDAMARQMSRPDDRRAASQFEEVPQQQVRARPTERPAPERQAEAAPSAPAAPDKAAPQVRRPGEAPRPFTGERNPLDDLLNALKGREDEPEAKPDAGPMPKRGRGYDGPGF
jgi:ATP-dependent exoDNAse (exonuclease V) alpha subunit